MAHKKTKKKSPKKSRTQQRRAAKEMLVRRTAENFQDCKVVVGKPTDRVKMSEVLEDFIEPYRNSAHTLGTLRKLLKLAVLAWNLTLLPEKKALSDLQEFLLSFPEEQRQAIGDFFRKMMVRKEQNFSQYRRAILDFEVVDLGNGWHIEVASTPHPV